MGFRVWVSGFGVWDLGFEGTERCLPSPISVTMAQGGCGGVGAHRFMVEGLGFKVWAIVEHAWASRRKVRSPPPARLTTTLSLKVNFSHAIKFRALCSANLVT